MQDWGKWNIMQEKYNIKKNLGHFDKLFTICVTETCHSCSFQFLHWWTFLRFPLLGDRSTLANISTHFYIVFQLCLIWTLAVSPKCNVSSTHASIYASTCAIILTSHSLWMVSAPNTGSLAQNVTVLSYFCMIPSKAMTSSISTKQLADTTQT